MKNLKLYFKIYFVALFVFLVIDILWIGLFANSFYNNRIGFLITESPNYYAALIFYLIFIAGLIFLIVWPALKDSKISAGIVRAAFYGLVTYGTYDLTNLALIKNWPISVTIVDMIWGVSISVIIFLISIYLGKYLQNQEE